MKLDITEINIDTFQGRIPSGHDLVIFEKGDPDSALTLYGFDEVNDFNGEFITPVYGFAKIGD